MKVEPDTSMARHYTPPLLKSGLTLTFALFMAFLPATALAGDTTPPIETLMSEEERQATGIVKLTPAERQALNAWLARQQDAVTPTPASEPTSEPKSERVRTVYQARPDKVTATVIPAFKGWSGETVFELDNGEVWQQRLPGRFYYKGDDSDVVIKKNFLRFYVLEHVASGESIGVKQIR
jgi:hypothetical protein